MYRSLFLAALLSSSTVAADEPSPPPRDAPAACTAPISGTGLSKTLVAGPKVLGTYKFANGKSVTTPDLKIIGKGERLPVLSDNYEPGSAPGVARVGPYRVTTKVLTTEPLVYEAKVELLGCEKDATHPPLVKGETHTFWMSTNGLYQMRFSKGNWFDNDPSFFMTFNSELDPRVQQTDMKRPHGYMSWNAGNGSMNYNDQGHLYYDDLKVGAVRTLHDHKVEILNIVLGSGTERIEGRICTKGEEPTAHVPIRVTKL